MAKEIFKWSPSLGATGSVKFRVLKAQFGDGYAQTAPDGINNRSSSWPLSFTGVEAKIRPIKDFLDRQSGATSFLWTPPLGAPGYFKVVEYQYAPQGGRVFTLTATFEESPQP